MPEFMAPALLVGVVLPPWVWSMPPTNFSSTGTSNPTAFYVLMKSQKIGIQVSSEMLGFFPPIFHFGQGGTFLDFQLLFYPVLSFTYLWYLLSGGKFLGLNKNQSYIQVSNPVFSWLFFRLKSMRSEQRSPKFNWSQLILLFLEL